MTTARLAEASGYSPVAGIVTDCTTFVNKQFCLNLLTFCQFYVVPSVARGANSFHTVSNAASSLWML